MPYVNPANKQYFVKFFYLDPIREVWEELVGVWYCIIDENGMLILRDTPVPEKWTWARFFPAGFWTDLELRDGDGEIDVDLMFSKAISIAGSGDIVQ